MRFYVSKYIGHGVRIGAPVNLGGTTRRGPAPMAGVRPVTGRAIPWCLQSIILTVVTAAVAVAAIWWGWGALIAAGFFLIVACKVQGDFITQCEAAYRRAATTRTPRTRP